MSNKPKSRREFLLTSLSIGNRTTVYVLIALITFSGLYSYITVPKESFPEIIIPEIFVVTAYPGNSPENMEKLITRPLEKEINAISGVDEILSSSSQGFSTIDVKFTFDVNPTQALRKVKDAVDKVKADSDFPKDLPADPSVSELNISEMMPMMNVNLSGDYSLLKLKQFAEYFQDKFEDLPQISKVDIRGASDFEVEIEFDYLRAEAMQVSFNDIASSLAAENLTIAGGDLLVDGIRRNVQVSGDFQSMQDIESVIVKAENMRPIYVRDVATVSFAEKEKESYAREYSKPVITLDIVKRAGENLLDASDRINEIIALAKLEVLPPDVLVTITADQSDAIRSQVDELQNSIIFGILLVVGVLLFFLGLRNAIFVGVAIPLSMFMSFMILGVLGISFNTMVLFALVLALGMLVDNGIVVVENVYRYMSEGFSPFDAAKYGVGEVAWPIIASTCTTLAAFAPLAFWPGIIGEFMKYLPITLMIVLGSSLFVALVINPVLTAVFMKIEEDKTSIKRTWKIMLSLCSIGVLMLMLGATALGNILIVAGLLTLLNTYVLAPTTAVFQKKTLPYLENAYERMLSYILKGRRPSVFFFGTFALMAFSFLLMGIFPPKVEFFPENQPQYLNIFISKPIGTDLEITNVVTKDVEARVFKVIEDEQFKRENPDTGELESFIVNSVIAQVGNGTSDPAEGATIGNTPHKARIAVGFVKYQKRRGLSTVSVLNAIREDLKGYPDANVIVTKNSDGPPQAPPINIEISGDDYDILLATAESLRYYLNQESIPGVEDLKIDINKSKPEMSIDIDRDKARRYGLSTRDIGSTMRAAIFGREIGTFKDGEDDYPINLRFSDQYRNNASALMNQKIIFRSQSDGQIKEVPVSAVATSSRASTFNMMKRKDLDRVITMSSNILEGYNANEIVASMQQSLTQFDSPAGANISFTGQMEEQAKEMAFLSKALLVALFLIFLIIVAQFNSITTPFIIGFSVFFSLIGVLLGLVIFQMDFVIIMTMIGIISLAGVVVNNAIVLLDYINIVRERYRIEQDLPEGSLLPFGEVVRAVIQGGKTRLRPVLLTAITTILGLLPLAIGINIDFVSLITTYDPHIYIGGDNNVFWKPMSWAIIYGLTFATFLTLVLVPVMYWWMVKMSYKFSGKPV